MQGSDIWRKGHFSEGASLQGRQVAWSRGHPPMDGQVGHGASASWRTGGAWEGRALRNDPVGHFSEGVSLQGRQVAWSRGHGAPANGRTSGARSTGGLPDKTALKCLKHVRHPSEKKKSGRESLPDKLIAAHRITLCYQYFLSAKS